MSDNHTKALLNSPILGFAHHRIILDEAGKPADYEFLEVNTTFERLTGLTKENILNRTVRSAIPGIRQADFDWVGFYGDIALNGGEKDIEQYSETLNRWYRVHIYSTEKMYFSTLFLDITESKKTLEDLKQVSARLSLAARAGGVGVWDYDIVGNVLVWDEQMYRLYGIDDTTFSGVYQAWRSGLHPADLERGDEEINLAISGKKDFDTEFRVVWPDGAIHNIRALAIVQRDENGKPLRLIGTNWDITAQKHTEESLLVQSRLQQLLIETSTVFINISIDDMEKTIAEALGKIAEFVGADRSYVFEYDFDKQICNNTYEWCASGIAPQIDELQGVPIDAIPSWIDCHRNGKTMYVTDVLALKEDDSVRQILEPQEVKSLIAVPMMHNGQCTGFVGFDSVRNLHAYSDDEQKVLTVFAHMMVNLSIRMQAQEALHKAVTAAEAASKAKSEFLANMSHEIRTPLNGVIGFTDLLQGTPLSPVQQQYVKNANSSGHILLGIINDILDFSKIEAGMMNLEIIKTDMIALLSETMAIIKFASDKKNIKALLDIDSAMPRFASVDPVRLKQIFTNLLGNAVKFTEKGEIELKAVYEDTVNKQGRFRFSVRDTGIGINEEQKAKLFKAFSQADSSTTRKFGGTGLGLIISEMIAKKMGSEIKIESIPGKGTTFCFEIVADIEYGDNIQIEEPEIITAAPEYATILIAEDVPMNMLLIKTIVAKMLPYARIIEASNGLEAVAQYQEERPNIILMDMQMAEMDGVEATVQIRKIEKTDNIHTPIIALTAGALIEEREKCFAAGMDDFLTKPIEPAKLLQTFNRFLIKCTYRV